MARRAPKDATTAERLLDAAIRAFGAHGYEATRLEDIAGEAGITRPSLLHHYKSKDELYAAALEHAFASLERKLERAVLREGTYEERLDALVEALVDFERANLPGLAVLLRGAIRGDDPIAKGIIERSLIPLIDRLESFVRLGVGARLPKKFPVRAAILQLVFAHLVRSAMGEVGEALWKGDAQTLTLSRLLLSPEKAPQKSPEKSREKAPEPKTDRRS
jgi:AcrR family transcriptional regulator